MCILNQITPYSAPLFTPGSLIIVVTVINSGDINVMDSEASGKTLPNHHIQQDLCTTRLPYRQGRKFTAVKVYSICNESQHLMIYGVPSLNLDKELKTLLKRYGEYTLEVANGYTKESFTETYHVRYEKIQSARVAKRHLDTKNFYGGSLHVCYAPEFESVLELRSKIYGRKNAVLKRLKINETEKINLNSVKEKNINQEFKYDYLDMYTDTRIKSDEKRTEINTSPSCDISAASRKRIGPMCDYNLPKKLPRVDVVIEKQFQPTFINDTKAEERIGIKVLPDPNRGSTSEEFVPNLKFGGEVVKKVDERPVNKIVLTVKKK